jgi:hypothetical protein
VFSGDSRDHIAGNCDTERARRRLGTYTYLDVAMTIKEALDAAPVLRDRLAGGEPIPAFVVVPLG